MKANIQNRKGPHFMKMKRLMCALLACSSILGGIIPSAQAVEAPSETVVWLEDLNWECVDLSTVEHYQAEPMPLTTDKLDQSVPGNSIGFVTTFIDLSVNDLVTFDCSYSPLSASMDFGVITSTGRFYHINVKEGSINQAIRISQDGSYAVAIRNNSSQTVRVVGFVDD